MVTTTSDRKAKAPRVALRQSIARYAAGEFTKRDIEKVFASALDQDPSCGEVIREYLDQQLHERALSQSVYKDLLEQLASHLPEDVPTETAEHVQAEASAHKVTQSKPAAAATPSAEVSATPAPKPAVAKAPGARTGKSAKSAAAQPKQTAAPVSTEQKKSERTLAPGTILRERFRLDEAVASGSMGLVFRATDLLKLEAGALSPVIAIKVINPEFSNNAAALRSFQNEVANTQHLSHPNIIRLFELDKDQGHYFITMEWLEGESLDALLDRSRGSALPPVQAYAIIEQLCDALIYAHGKQVIHADIKPGNVFLTKPGELKLIDFGIARIHNPQDKAGNGQESMALTPAYASCECLEQQTATEQDDLFSLACLIYRLLSGRRVFGTRTALQAEAEKIEPVAIGGMSAQRWRALRKALSFRRGDRQPDVRTFAEEFGQRSEPRGKFEPDPDDVKFTETTTLGAAIAEESEAILHDTGSLRAMEFPIDLDDDTPRTARAPADFAAQRLEAEIELSDVLQASGVLELPEPINFFDDAGCDESVFVPVEEQSGRFPLDMVESTVPETRLATESTIPAESRAATESTVPDGRTRSGTIEIEILKDLPQSPGITVPAAPAPSAFSMLDGDPPAVSVTRSAPPVEPASTPGSTVKPPAPKTPETQRNAVVEALTAPPPPEPPPPTFAKRLVDAILARQRLALAAAGVLVLIAVLFGGDDAAIVPNASRTAVESPGVSSRAKQAGADSAAERGKQILVGNPDGTGAAIDAAAIAAESAEPETVLNTVDTGISSDAAAVPVPLGVPRGKSARPQRSPAPATVTPQPPTAAPASESTSPVAQSIPAPPTDGVQEQANAAASATAAASAESSPSQETATPDVAPADNVGDYDPNGPVPFSALQLAHYVEPKFPEAYSDQTIEGWVDVSFRIDTAGNITSLELIDTNLPPDFLAPSRAAVGQWRFKPFIWNGIPLAASTTVRLTYSN